MNQHQLVITFCHCYSVSDLKQKRVSKGLCNPLSDLVPHKNPILLDKWQFLLDSGVVRLIQCLYVKALSRATCIEPCSETSASKVVTSWKCHFWPHVQCICLFSSRISTLSKQPNISPSLWQWNSLFFFAYWVLHLTISSRLSVMETRANAHLDYCVFYWRNCNADVLLIFGKPCIYLPVF